MVTSIAVELSEQEGKMRDDIWFAIFHCCLNKDPAFQEHKGSEVSLNWLLGVNKRFCQNQDPFAGGPVQACSKESKPQNPNPEESHSK